MHRTQRIAAAAVAILTIAGCRGGGVVPPQAAGMSNQSAGALPDKEYSILKMLKKEVVIGSTVDPKFGQLNPYGLTVAPSTTGDFTKGDLVVCNFNDKKNVQGTGFTIVALHPKPGSKPLLVSHDKTLVGCDALALGPADDIWAPAWIANDNPVLSASGKLEVNIKGKPFDHPFGQIFAQPTPAARRSTRATPATEPSYASTSARNSRTT